MSISVTDHDFGGGVLFECEYSRQASGAGWGMGAGEIAWDIGSEGSGVSEASLLEETWVEKRFNLTTRHFARMFGLGGSGLEEWGGRGGTHFCGGWKRAPKGGGDEIDGCSRNGNMKCTQ